VKRSTRLNDVNLGSLFSFARMIEVGSCSGIGLPATKKMDDGNSLGSKGLSINNLRNLAPRFGTDLDGTIEKKPRHSLDYVEVFSIEARSKMVRRWDARW